MEIAEIARTLDTPILQPAMTPAGCADTVVSSDRMSDLLEQATPTTLILTALATPQVLDMAELMDAPAVCITPATEPTSDFLARAARCRVPVILSRLGPVETRRRIHDLLGPGCGAQP